MAFRAYQYSVAGAYQIAVGGARQLRIAVVDPFIAHSGANTISWSEVADLKNRISAFNTQLTIIALTPGIAQYAKDQVNDQAYDVVAEFSAMQLAVTNVLDWLTTNIPVTGLTGDTTTGEITNTYGTGATAPLRALLQTLSDSIELVTP